MDNEVKTIDEPTERLDNKIKTSEIMIIVGGSVDKPCYSIRYYDLFDNEWHVGFSSYQLSYVMNWKTEFFEFVEPVESIKPMETKRNWEAECKRLKDNADDKNRELIQLKEKISDLRRKNYYLDGKTDAYEYAIKCFEKGS